MLISSARIDYFPPLKVSNIHEIAGIALCIFKCYMLWSHVLLINSMQRTKFNIVSLLKWEVGPFMDVQEMFEIFIAILVIIYFSIIYYLLLYKLYHQNNLLLYFTCNMKTPAFSNFILGQ